MLQFSALKKILINFDFINILYAGIAYVPTCDEKIRECNERLSHGEKWAATYVGKSNKLNINLKKLKYNYKLFLNKKEE